jgi:hypothetical protein
LHISGHRRELGGARAASTIRVGAVTPHLPTRRIAARRLDAMRRRRELVRNPCRSAGLARMLRRAGHPPRRVNPSEATKGTDAMALPISQPFATRRPANPRCRGGVSSLLRLAQPAAGGAQGPKHPRAAHAPTPYRFPDR